MCILTFSKLIIWLPCTKARTSLPGRTQPRQALACARSVHHSGEAVAAAHHLLAMQRWTNKHCRCCFHQKCQHGLTSLLATHRFSPTKETRAPLAGKGTIVEGLSSWPIASPPLHIGPGVCRPEKWQSCTLISIRLHGETIPLKC